MASDYCQEMNDVITDMMKRLRHIRDTQGEERYIPNLPNELYRWSMECEYIVHIIVLQIYQICVFVQISKPRIQAECDFTVYVLWILGWPVRNSTFC